MRETEPANMTEAERLTDELSTAYGGVLDAVRTYGEVQGRVNEYLDEHEVIPPPPEGLAADVNDLYQLWNRTPNVPELDRVLCIRLN